MCRICMLQWNTNQSPRRGLEFIKHSHDFCMLFFWHMVKLTIVIWLKVLTIVSFIALTAIHSFLLNKSEHLSKRILYLSMTHYGQHAHHILIGQNSIKLSASLNYHYYFVSLTLGRGGGVVLYIHSSAAISTSCKYDLNYYGYSYLQMI